MSGLGLFDTSIEIRIPVPAPRRPATAEVSEADFPVIFQITRADLIADGSLIDVSEMAREAGFKIPVAISAGAWNDCVAWDDSDTNRQTLQDQSGRLWDVLWMAMVAARNSRNTSIIRFPLLRVPRDGRSREAEETTLKSIISGGDNGEPVITILLPHED